MSDARWTEVDNYLAETLLPHDAVLEAALTANAAAKLPAIDVSPLQGALLTMLARLVNAKRILEIGTLGGYSTICLARALPAEGRLLSFEFEPRHAQVAGSNIAHAGLAERVEIRVGPALDSLAKLATENPAPFDLIFLDADKRNNANYLERVLAFTRPGTLIVLDNIIREGAILDAATTDPDVQGQRRALAIMGSNPRLSATALQTTGVKGWDGFAIALVND